MTGRQSMLLVLQLSVCIESDDSGNEAGPSKKKKRNTCTLVWEVSIVSLFSISFLFVRVTKSIQIIPTYIVGYLLYLYK